MSEDMPFNPDTAGTHPNSQPVPTPPAQTMAEAIASMSTAVRVLPDGSHELINPEAYAAIYGPTEQTAASIPEEVHSQSFTIDTRLINGQAHLCAVAPDGSIITSRGQGNNGSPELYDLVYQEAQKIINEES